jgi:hypothetical protein
MAQMSQQRPSEEGIDDACGAAHAAAHERPGRRIKIGPVTVFVCLGALMLIAGVIMLGTDPCLKDSTAGCNPGSHTTFWASALTIAGSLTFVISAWVQWFSRSPKER